MAQGHLYLYLHMNKNLLPSMPVTHSIQASWQLTQLTQVN